MEPIGALIYDDTDRRPRWRRVVDALLGREFHATRVTYVERDPEGPFTITWNTHGIFTSQGPIERREAPPASQ